MNNERYDIESTIVASAINNEDFFMLLRANNIKNSDFKNELCSMIFKFMEEISENNITPKSYNIENKIVTTLLHEGISMPKIKEIASVFEYILTKKEDDLLACNALMEKFIKIKTKDNLIDILDSANKMLNDIDAKEAVDYIFESYHQVNSVEKKDIVSTNFCDLMKDNLNKYSHSLNNEINTNKAFDNEKL